MTFPALFPRLVAFVLAGQSLAGAAESKPAASPLPKVVLLGDSIRMNYQATVTEALDGEAVVWAPKENCRHTVFVLENLDRWLSEGEGEGARVIHLNVGLHDLFLDGKTGKPRHDLDTYEENLRAIFKRLAALSETKVIFALTTVVNEQQQAESEGYGRVVRRNTDIEIYNAKARAVAEEYGMEVNDLNQFMKKTGPETLLRASDGIHLSPEGCQIMGREVARLIRANLNPEDEANEGDGPSQD